MGDVVIDRPGTEAIELAEVQGDAGGLADGDLVGDELDDDQDVGVVGAVSVDLETLWVDDLCLTT